ncbi:MAG: MBL fold metallo-hydrolase [Leptonema sp. (in: Bacteria)]|nr:MBL fold metallo-hydrolase [Leptonema sp. (in: bacteria)]
MKVKFWGVRGSIPSPLRGHTIRDKMKRILTLASPADILDEVSVERFIKSLPFSLTHTYGGNTTCLEIRSKNNDLIIIDAGTGLRELGNRLLVEDYGKGKGEAHILFTHSHWDHIQGLPFFVPAYIEGNTFHIHAISDNIDKRLIYQHNFDHFPVPFDGLKANKIFYQHQKDETWQLHGINISTHSMRHPGGSWSYRLEEDGKVLIFGSDAEFRAEEMENLDATLDYFRDADILIFDTQYTFEEQLQKIDWGHSSASIATDIAMKAGVKHLVLFHHDPSYSDEKLDEVYMRAIRYKEMMDVNDESQLQIHIAYEGLEMVV